MSSVRSGKLPDLAAEGRQKFLASDGGSFRFEAIQTKRPHSKEARGRVTGTMLSYDLPYVNILSSLRGL